ncbi:helicase C-terminal domain-containing protein [Acidiplasma aeolicum]|jgi:DNA excision repair protein ERCC-2|uniref:DNA repair helicase n=1 Tax=Acidiplasma aeolicum TaxID=507754 RepID=A0A0Q0RL60_9ARCH|nr:ATP-dependent DNA helicase [Acidiplasma aeolicum]KQB36270.1 DNA repair helicase [Acidiplasma aeolicum]
MEPFHPREWQGHLFGTVEKNLEDRNVIALEAPTGSGKTSFILYLSFMSGKKLIYVTRTHNEFTRLYEDNIKYFDLPVIYLYGKSTLCPLKERWYDSDEESQKNVCKGCILKDKIMDIDMHIKMPPDDYYNKIISLSIENIRNDINNNLIKRDSKGNLIQTGNGNITAYCPYYSVRSSMKNATVVAMTYNYLLNPSIRFNIFHGTEGEESMDINDYYIIFDEAHNIDSVIENFGRSISEKTVNGSINELVDTFPLEEYKCHERIGANLLLEKLEKDIEGTKSGDDLKLFRFSDDVKSRLGDINYIQIFSEKFQAINDNRPIKERRRNYLETVYNFLYDAQRLENGDIYSQKFYPERGDPYKRLRIMYYNTSEYLKFLKNKPVLFMSGTMPSADHISKIWNFENMLYIRVNDIFYNTGGVKKYSIVKGFSTLGRYRDNTEIWSDILKKYMEFIIKTYSNSINSVLVAVPSYKILYGDHDKRIPGIADYLPDELRPFSVFENKKLTYSLIIKKALSDKLIIFSVHGGRLLEGIQITKNNRSLISDVIIAGLPLMPLDDYRKNKIKYLEKTLSGENIYSLLYYEYALIKIKQAAGRSTRSPDDVANIYLCDDRFDSKYWRDNLLNN